MRKRIENLKKMINSSLVDFSYLQALEKTDNELDALYITFYRLKSLSLKYKRELYGTVNEVEYEPKFDWDKYLNEYLKGITIIQVRHLIRILLEHVQFMTHILFVKTHLLGIYNQI